MLVAIDSERVAIPDEVEEEEEFPSPKRERNDRIKPWAPFEEEEDEGMASKPSSLAPALSGADPAAAGVPGAPPPAPVEASRLRSSSRKSDCLALSSARVGERALLLLLLEEGEAVPPEALASEDEPDMSDLVRRIKRGGRWGCRVDWSARSERRTWRCLIDPREKEEIPWPGQQPRTGPEGRRATDHSLCCVSDILARQSGCTVDGEDDTVSCREVLRERTGAQARMAGDVDEVERRVQLGGVALRAGVVQQVA